MSLTCRGTTLHLWYQHKKERKEEERKKKAKKDKRFSNFWLTKSCGTFAKHLATIRFISALCWSENEMDHESHSSGTTVEILVSQSADIKKKICYFSRVCSTWIKSFCLEEIKSKCTLWMKTTPILGENALHRNVQLKRLKKTVFRILCNMLFSISLNSVKDFQNKMCLRCY